MKINTRIILPNLAFLLLVVGTLLVVTFTFFSESKILERDALATSKASQLMLRLNILHRRQSDNILGYSFTRNENDLARSALLLSDLTAYNWGIPKRTIERNTALPSYLTQLNIAAVLTAGIFFYLSFLCYCRTVVNPLKQFEMAVERIVSGRLDTTVDDKIVKVGGASVLWYCYAFLTSDDGKDIQPIPLAAPRKNCVY